MRHGGPCRPGRPRHWALKAGADVSGALLIITGLMLGIYAIVGTAQYGWTSARTLGLAAIAALLLAGFLVRQAMAATPLMPLRILRSRGLVGANLVQILMISAMFAFQIVVSLAMQHVLGYGAAATGLAMLPAAVCIGATALLISARLIARFGATDRAYQQPDHAGRRTAAVAAPAGARRLCGRPAPEHAADLGWRTGDAHRRRPGACPDAREQGRRSGIRPLQHHATTRRGGRCGEGAHHPLGFTHRHPPAPWVENTPNALMGGYHLAFGVGAGLLLAAIMVAIVVLRPEPTADHEQAVQ